MKWKVKNTTTGNFVSGPIGSMEAQKLVAQLNWSGDNYKAVPVELETEKLATTMKPMSEDVREAIKQMERIVFPPASNHKDFSKLLIRRTSSENNFEISEKEEAYLWYIIHRYRRQVTERNLVQKAIQNKVY